MRPVSTAALGDPPIAAAAAHRSGMRETAYQTAAAASPRPTRYTRVGSTSPFLTAASTADARLSTRTSILESAGAGHVTTCQPTSPVHLRHSSASAASRTATAGLFLGCAGAAVQA